MLDMHSQHSQTQQGCQISLVLSSEITPYLCTRDVEDCTSAGLLARVASWGGMFGARGFTKAFPTVRIAQPVIPSRSDDRMTIVSVEQVV